MLIDKPIVDVYSEIPLEDAKDYLASGEWGEDSALRIVVQDTIRAENFANQKSWVMSWPVASTLYQSPYTPRYWEGTQSERANVPFYTVATAVNSMVPQIINGLFYENPPFMIQERPGTSSQAARAIGALIAYQLEDIKFREELRLGVMNAVLFGTGIFKWGWETYTEKHKIYRLKEMPIAVESPLSHLGAKPIELMPTDTDVEEEEIEEYIDRPTFEHIVNLRYVLVDPGLNVPDIRKAKYVIHRMYMTWDDLDRLRDRPGFNIPSREDLLELFFHPKEQAVPAMGEMNIRNPLWDARAEVRYEPTTIDPFNEPLEVLERWDNDKYIVVLQRKLVIANDVNVYGRIPFLSVGWWDTPESFWGMGLAKTIGPEQRLQQGITNTWLDNAALNLNGVFIRVKGKSVPTQSIRMSPGKIVEVDNKDDFQVLDRLPPVPEAGAHLTLSQQRAEVVSGASEAATQGIAGASGHSNLARTATGAGMLGAGSGSRTADFVEKLASNVILPFCYHMQEMNARLLPLATIRYILSDELQHQYMQEEGDLVALLNAKLRFTILAAAKMQARRNMAQALPILIQYLTSPQTIQQLGVQGKKVDIAEVIRMMFEVSDWKNYKDVVLDMTPEEKQRSQANSPAGVAAARGQAQQQGMAMQGQQKSQLIDQENISRAGREVLRAAIEKSGQPETVTGEPGGVGFGTSA